MATPCYLKLQLKGGYLEGIISHKKKKNGRHLQKHKLHQSHVVVQ